MTLITFDLDGVLQNNPFGSYVLPRVAQRIRPFWRGIPPQFLAPIKKGVAPAPERIQKSNLDVKNSEIIAAIYAQTVLWVQEGRLKDAYDWDAAAGCVARAVGCPAEFDVSELVKEGCRLGHISSFPGAARVLETLSNRGHVLVAVSNGFTRYQRPVLEALNLYKYFTALVSPEETGVAKPDPAIFYAVAERLGLDTVATAIHVGDTLIHDMAGAKAADMRGVWMFPALPQNIAALGPIERVGHPDIIQILTARKAKEFASTLYDQTLEQLTPAAVVTGLHEIPSAIDALGDHFTSEVVL